MLKLPLIVSMLNCSRPIKNVSTERKAMSNTGLEITCLVLQPKDSPGTTEEIASPLDWRRDGSQ